MIQYDDLDLGGKLGDFLANIGDFKSRIEMLLEDNDVKVGDDGEIKEWDTDPSGNLR